MASYFFNDTINELFTPENTIEICNEKYQPTEEQKKIDFLKAKAGLLDKGIWDGVEPIYKFIDAVNKYYMSKSDDEKKDDANYQHFVNLKTINYQNLKIKEDDKQYFSKLSEQPYIVNGCSFIVDYLHIIDNFVKDFNSNYFEYYLMAQHAEQYNCCFIYTFRQMSKFISRTINCPFFYCVFDNGVDNYINDVQSSIINEFKDVTIEKDENGNITEITVNDDISDENMENNLDLLITYLEKRKKFAEDLRDFYNKLFKFIEKFLEFLAGLKVMLKVISIISIILNSHKDDSPMFLEHVNSLTNLISFEAPSMTPAMVDTYYTQYAQVFQLDVIPEIIIMKINFENDSENQNLTLYEKNKINHIFIMFALGSAGLVSKCQSLFSDLTQLNSNVKEKKKEWAETKDNDYIKTFIVKALKTKNDGKITYVDPCYVTDYDNPPTEEDLKKLKKQIENCKKAGYDKLSECPDDVKNS
jgi:hypothetical protein